MRRLPRLRGTTNEAEEEDYEAFFSWLLVITMLVISVASAENSDLSIHFIDVGQADAAVVLCDDEMLMIDGGNVADSSLIYSYLKNTPGLDHMIHANGAIRERGEGL